MRKRQALNSRHVPRCPYLPQLWMMTDERMGDRLLPSIAALPRGSGIVFRHYSLAPKERRGLFEQVRAAARRYRHTLLIGGDPAATRGWPADGSHYRLTRRSTKRHAGLASAPVHSIRERVAAERAGADLLFMSPVFATRSHTGGSLGRARFGLMRRGANLPVIALGGITASKARSLRAFDIHGWAAIDSLTILAR